MKNLEQFLKDKGIKIKGILLDRIYVYPINDKGIEYCNEHFFKGDNCYFFFQS